MGDSVHTILPIWTDILEHNLEAGQIPVLNLGFGTLSPDAVESLAALRQLTRRRHGMVEPMVTVGGDGLLWLLVVRARIGRSGLSHGESRPAGEEWEERQMALVEPVIFTGADAATHLASLNLLAVHTVDQENVPIHTIAPAGLRWQLAPGGQPGALPRWDWLPFRPAKSMPPVAAAWYSAESWAAYVALVVAAGLLVAALIL